jgi:hypothetical protein
MGRGFDISWVGGQNTMGMGGQNTMGRGVKIPWLQGSIYNEQLVKIPVVGGSKYHG